MEIKTRLDILCDIEKETEASLNIDIPVEDKRFNDKWVAVDDLLKHIDKMQTQIRIHSDKRGDLEELKNHLNTISNEKTENGK